MVCTSCFFNGINPYFLIGLYLTFLKFVFEVLLYVFGGPYLPFLKITSGGMLPLNFTLSFWWSVPLFRRFFCFVFVLLFYWVYSNSSSLFCQYFFIIYFILLNFQNLLSFKNIFLSSRSSFQPFPLVSFLPPPPLPRKGAQTGRGRTALCWCL